MASVGTVVIEVDANTAKLIDGVKKTQKQVSGLQKSVSKAKNDIANFAKAVVGIYAVAKAFEAVKSAAFTFVETSAKFEQFETTLTSITGSAQKAQESMQWITDFTSQTPFQLEQVTSAFVKMKAYGIDPTDGTLKTLGDTASAMGKDINQAVEAMADAITGENERLKEFGIKAKKQGEEITYAWTDSSGASREIVIENNKAIIESTLNAIFNDKYVGAMEAQSKTWNGILSNMKDEWTVFQNSVMEEGLFDYLKATAMTVKDYLSGMFGKGKDGAKAFGETIISYVKSAIETFGWLSDAIDGVKLAFKAVQYAVLGMSKIIMEAINYPLDRLNDMIGLYNSVVGALGGEAIQISFAPTIDTTWTDQTMAALKQEMGDLVDSLANQEGLNAANAMIKQIDVNLQKLTETEKANNEVKKEANALLDAMGAKYVETGLAVGMATDAELDKIYADELAAMGLDEFGDELEEANKKLNENRDALKIAGDEALNYADSLLDANSAVSSVNENIGTNQVGGSVVVRTADEQFWYEQQYDPYANWAGFSDGGYTGNMAVDDVAGVVHGQEYVVDAKTTKDLGLNGSGGVFESIDAKLGFLYEMTVTLKKMLKTNKSTNTLLVGAL